MSYPPRTGTETDAQAPQVLRMIADQVLACGGPLNRFVDTINVNWTDIAMRLNATEDACRTQIQIILDTLFGRSKFTDRDRELLCRLMEFETLEQNVIDDMKRSMDSSVFPSMAVPEGLTVNVVRYLQRNYFPGYSASQIAREYRAMSKLYRVFKKASSAK